MTKAIFFAAVLAVTIGPRSGHVTWSGAQQLSALAAADAGTSYSDPIALDTSRTAGAFISVTAAPGAAQMAGSVCVLEVDGHTTAMLPGTCQALDGGAGPWTWDLSGLHAQSIALSYEPGASTDGGTLSAAYTVRVP